MVYTTLLSDKIGDGLLLLYKHEKSGLLQTQAHFGGKLDKYNDKYR